MSGQILGYSIAFVAGIAVPFLAAINAAFGQTIGSVYGAALVLCCVAFAAIFVVAYASGATLPTISQLRGASWWHFAAGLFFAVYVVSITFVAPKIGVGNAIIFVVVAQIFTAVIIDHFGLFGAAVREIDLKRIAGAGLLVAGIALARS